MHGFGCPSSIPGASIETFGPGFGTPTGGAFADSVRGRGFGHPSALGFMTAESGLFVVAIPHYAYPFSFPRVTAFSHEVSDEGGELVTLAGSGLPTRGPYRIRLFDQHGVFWPDDRDGCYGAVAGLGSDVFANGSREYIRFAMPLVPQGVYGIELAWGDGTSMVTIDDALLVVPRALAHEADWFVRRFK